MRGPSCPPVTEKSSMDDVIVINHSDESEEDEQRWRKSRKRRLMRRFSASPTQEIIDLTGNSDIFAYVTSADDNIIDLTGHEEDTSLDTFQWQMKSEPKFDTCSLSETGESDLESEVILSSPMNVESCNGKDLKFDDQSSEGSFRSACSTICSIEYMTDLCQTDNGLPGSRDADLPSKSNMKHPYVKSLHIQDRSHQDFKSVLSEIVTQVQHITSSTPVLLTAVQKNPEETLRSQSTLINKSLVYNTEEASCSQSNLANKSLVYNTEEASCSQSNLANKSLVYNTEEASCSQSNLVNKSLIYNTEEASCSQSNLVNKSLMYNIEEASCSQSNLANKSLVYNTEEASCSQSNLAKKSLMYNIEEASCSQSNLANKSLVYNTEEASCSQSNLVNKSLVYNTEEASCSQSNLANKSLMYNTEEASCSQSNLVNKSLVYKLRYFKKPPVSHLLPHMFRRDQNSQPVSMPLSRVNIVNSTKDEGFHQGTLYFLSEFVSANHYPSKDLISHVINSILLAAEEQSIRNEAYVMLMRVQRLHPASSESVAWEWKLLSEVMSKQENHTCHLFLQYVVQTLDDDFHLCLQRRSLHKCLCKSMLSCDKSFCNVKQVIHWLIDTMKQIREIGQDSSSQCSLERVVFLLQHMLSIAVEVDNSPTMNSNKIADYIFPYVTVLKTRQQREMFFNSTENSLLRAKILEVIFYHSCESPPSPEVSLGFGKVLYFIKNFTLQLENQGPEWQRWDEMLHHIMLLCLSLQTIITNHLRTPIIDRTDEIIKRPQRHLYLSEDITESEVDISLTFFRQRASPGAEPAVALLNRLFLLRSLLHTAVKR